MTTLIYRAELDDNWGANEKWLCDPSGYRWWYILPPSALTLHKPTISGTPAPGNALMAHCTAMIQAAFHQGQSGGASTWQGPLLKMMPASCYDDPSTIGHWP